MKVRDLWKVMDREDGQKIYVYEAGIEKDLVASMDKEVSSFWFNETLRAFVIYLK